MMQSRPQLKRALGLYATTSIVIGSVVGSGIFSKPASMAADLPDASLLISVWIFTGILTLFGALTQCEIVSQMPKTGGLYYYFREIYGERVSFLYGWANLMIAGSGAIAAISFIFALYLSSFVSLPHFSEATENIAVHLPMGDIFPLKDIGVKAVAGLVVIFLTLLNIRGVKQSGTMQSISTTSKILAIVGIVAIAFLAGSNIGSTSHWNEATATGHAMTGWSVVKAFALAMAGAFWAYDGWGNVAYIAGEVKTPAKTIPKAVIMGTCIFIALYVLVNLAYLYIIPIGAMAAVPEGRVASSMVSQVVGPIGVTLIAVLIMLSTFDTTNSSILTNARVYFAMATHKIFYRPTAKVHDKYQTPHVSLLIQGGWSLVLLLTGSFDLITDMYTFVNWSIYVLLGLAVFVLRKKRPNAVRPFKVPGYPVVPALFILFALAYVTLTLITDVQSYQAGEQPIMKSVTGIVLVLTGLPFYYYWKYKHRNLAQDHELGASEEPL